MENSRIKLSFNSDDAAQEVSGGLDKISGADPYRFPPFYGNRSDIS